MKNLSKHLKVITKNSKREVLKYVEFNGKNKVINATDSSRLLSFKNDSEVETYLLNLESLERLDGNYPNVSSILPLYGFDYEMKYSEISKGLLSELTKNKKLLLKLTFEDDKLKIEKEEKIDKELTEICSLNYITETKETHIIWFNAEYVRDCLSFIRDYGLDKKEDSFNIKLQSNIKPMLFKGDDFDYLIAPIRNKIWYVLTSFIKFDILLAS